MTNQQTKELRSLVHSLIDGLDTIDYILEYEDDRDEDDLASIPDRFKSVAIGALMPSHTAVVVDIAKFEEAMNAIHDDWSKQMPPYDSHSIMKLTGFKNAISCAVHYLEQQAGEE